MKVIFIDIDNTLLDFDEYVRHTMKEGFSRFGLKPYEPWMYDVFVRENNAVWLKIERAEITFEELQKIRWNNVFKALNIEFDGAVFEDYFRESLFNSAIVIDGAYEMLDALKKKAILCAASNGPYDQQMNRLKCAHMDHYFDYIFVSEKLGVSKPSRVFLDKAFKEMKVKPDLSDCWIIGDSMSSDMSLGKNYGMKTCLYRRKKDMNTDGIDVVVNQLKDVAKAINI